MKLHTILAALFAALLVSAADLPLEVVRATWGAGDRKCDATAFVSGRLREGKFLVLSAKNATTILGDPARMKTKELIATIRVNGEERTLSVGEYSAPIIVRTGGDYPVTEALTVYSATYGYGLKTADMLETVKTMMAEKKKAGVNNQFAGSDPAKNKPKELIVLYSVGNTLRALIVPEGKFFDPAEIR